MKRIIPIALSLMLAFGIAVLAMAAEKGTKGGFNAKAGDTIYVCGCGESCPCGTMAKQEGGTCACGGKLVKTTVTKVDKERVYYKLRDKEVSALRQGAYACACPGCACGTISQKPGMCGCGKDMMNMKAKKEQAAPASHQH